MMDDDELESRTNELQTELRERERQLLAGTANPAALRRIIDVDRHRLRALLREARRRGIVAKMTSIGLLLLLIAIILTLGLKFR